MNKLFNSLRKSALVLLAGVPLMAYLAVSVPDSAEALPPNFQISDVVTSGLTIPSGLEVLPDGRVFITELTGEVKIYKNGQLLPQPFITIPVNATVDRGLLGIVADTSFGSSPYVYFYYTDDNSFSTVARADASSDVAGPLEILYQAPEISPGQHVGGTVRIGLDDKLYVSMGDNQTPPNAQDTSSPFGSVLRLNKDGSIPADNPFVGQAGFAPEIYAYGFRNPFRMQIDSVTGNIYVGDVGQGAWEEVNLVSPGANYGWPAAEGDCDCGFVDPIYSYPHVGSVGSITMGPVYRGGNFPSEYEGDIFISDFSLGFLRHLDMANGGSTVVSTAEFETGLGTVVDVKQAPDGSLYMVSIFPGKVMRLSYNTSNQLPVVNAGADVTSGPEPLTVNFSSAGTSDGDGDPLDYTWDFGDGTTSNQPSPTKTYATPGRYNAKLTVSDGQGTVTSPIIVIQVGVPPTVTLSQPNEGDTYHAGDTLNYTVAATDQSGNPIPASNIVTRTLLHHDVHTHPHVGPFIGTSGSFSIPTTGETSTNTWYEVISTATDSNGLQNEDRVNVYPIVSNFSVDTTPAGLDVFVNGTPYTAPKTIDSVVGFERELSAPQYQIIGSQWYEFVSWSNGDDRTHLFTTPVAPTTVTATYQPTATPGTYFAEYFNNETLSGTPTFTQFEPTIDHFWEVGSGPDGGLQDDHFSIRWTKTDTYTAGDYEFSVTADDGVRVYLDGVLIIDEWHLSLPTTYTAQAALTAGQHEVIVEYYEHEIDASIAFGMTQLTGGGPSGEEGTQYWNLPNPSQYLVSPPSIPLSSPDYTTNDVDLNNFWGADSPVPGTINADRFVAVWNKTDTFTPGQYRFTVTSDDGVRVYVDGTLIIDEWNDHGPTTFTADVAGMNGSHDITVEYYENGFDALMQLDYQLVKSGGSTTNEDTTPNDGLYTARYWALGGATFPPEITTLGTPDIEQSESEINNDWGMGGPAGIGIDKFAAQWVKTDQFAAGTYDFSTLSDDGVRLYVDDVLVIDEWNDHSPTLHTGQAVLAAGEHTVRMEYYEHEFDAVAILATQFTPDGGGPGDPGEPGGGESTVTVYARGYLGSENINLSINGQTVASYDSISTATTAYTYTTTTPLTIDLLRVNFTNDAYINGGDRNVAIDRVEIDGVVYQSEDPANPALGHFKNDSCGVGYHSTEILYCNGWFEYVHAVGTVLAEGNNSGGSDGHDGHDHPYDVKFWNLPNPDSFLPFPPSVPQTAPDYTGQEQSIQYDWGLSSPVLGVINTDRFVGQWSKHHAFDGDYRFTITADDGVRVFIDSTLVLDEWNDHSATTYTIDLLGLNSTHDIVIQYYENGWDAVMEFGYEQL